MTESTDMGATDDKAWLQYYPDWTGHQLDYEGMTLSTIYRDNLAKFGNRPGISFFGAEQSWKDVDQEVRRAAAGLYALGVRRGDRVALLMPNCPQHVHAFFACIMLGAVPVEHNPLYTAPELKGPFADHGARIAIAWDKSVGMVETLRRDPHTALDTIVSVDMTKAMPLHYRIALRIPLPPLATMRNKLTTSVDGTVPWETLVSDGLGGDGSTIEPYEADPDDPALILYTSGTTGAPKGAELRHRNLVANVVQGKAWVPDLRPGKETFLVALPMFHAYGITMNMLFGPFIGGAKLILLPTPDMKLIMSIMKKQTPTWLPGVPTLYGRIAQEAAEKGIDIHGVRNSFSGASSLPVSTVEKWEALTKGHLIEGYGLTETSPIIAGNPMTDDRRPGYVGIPFPDTIIRIADKDNLDRTMPDGEAGELLVKGPQVFSGYINAPEANARSFHDGWYITGDVGIMEPDGFIRLVARTKEIIITGGFNVYPQEVEDVLNQHPDVEDSTVVGLPREDGSETIVAAISLEPGAALDPEGLKDYCRKSLARYKVPRTFYHLDDLPRDQMGKIRRRDVRDDIIERSKRS